MTLIRILGLAAVSFVCLSETAGAQTTTQSAPADEGWRVQVFPVLLWAPLDIGIDVDVTPVNGGGGASGDILESRFDGAYFGGVTVYNDDWRIEGYAIWAAFGGDRPERPFLTVDLDLIYGDARVGRRIAPDLFVTGGVRRLALEYDILLADLPRLSRKPGVWDPLVGLGWHRVREKVEWHAAFEGGGFGVGADVDLGATLRVDWKPLRHFGLSAGYNFLYLKLSDSVAARELDVKLTAHGPSVGIAFYF